MIRWKKNRLPHTQKYFMLLKVFYSAKLSNKQSAKVILGLTGLEQHTAAGDKQAIWALETY